MSPGPASAHGVIAAGRYALLAISRRIDFPIFLHFCRRKVVKHYVGLDVSQKETSVCIVDRSEEHTSELQSLMRISYAVFCLKKKNKKRQHTNYSYNCSDRITTSG